jgi:hypothetical protein
MILARIIVIGVTYFFTFNMSCVSNVLLLLLLLFPLLLFATVPLTNIYINEKV